MTDNELIAEFLGWKQVHTETADYWMRPEGGATNWDTPQKFQNSWDWLMPVVEKIDGLGYHVTIMKTRCVIAITLNVQNHIQSIHPGYSMIEVVYCAVVEFIKWYNEQKFQEEIKGEL